MRRDARRRCLAAVVLSLCAAGGARAAGGLDIEAQNISYARDGAIVEASGGVRASWDGNSLVAESVRYARETESLSAAGDVVLDTPDVLIDASSCELDIDDETGELRDGRIELKGSHSTFGGTTVRKLSGLHFNLDKAYFTTCDMKPDRSPDWSITGDHAQLEVEGYGKVRNAAFRIRGVPVLYTPVLVFPAMTTRQSGLLLPRIGASSKRGFMYTQPYFWAIDKHQDLTATAEIETSARLGIGLDYRYQPSRTTSGDAQLYYYNEAIRTESDTDVQSPLFRPDPNQNIPENRAVFEAHHRQRPSETLRFYGDVLLVTDDLVLRETNAVEGDLFGSETRRTALYTDSRLGTLASVESPNLGHTSYGFRASAYQDLVAPDRYTLQQPGRAWVSSDGDLPYGVGWNFDGQLGGFYRTEGADGQRVDVSTTLDRPLLRGEGPLRASSWIRGRLTGYRNQERTLLDVSPPQPPDDQSTAVDETEVGEPLKILDEYAGRAVGEAGVDLWTGFIRTYSFPGSAARSQAAARPAGTEDDATESMPGIWGEGAVSSRFSSLHHTIEPFSSLRFTTRSNQENLPLYDDLDRIDDRSTFTYGTNSRFLFTEAGNGRRSELARLSIAQTYDVNERVVNDHFSDVDVALGLIPTRNVSFSGLASYNVGSSSLRGAAASLAMEQFRLPFVATRRSQVEAAYRFVRRGAVPTAEQGLETLEARTILALTDTFAVGFNGRYDFVGQELVESGGGIRIESSCHCWTIDLGVINRSNPDETQFRVALELGGLGGFGSSALRYKTTGLSGFDTDVARAGRYGW